MLTVWQSVLIFARNGIPILLTTASSIPAPTKSAMSDKGTTSTIVVGGEISVSKSVYSQLPSPTRIGGNSRFEVATNIAKKYYSSSKAHLSAMAINMPMP